jgi:hypothetical protein
MLISFTVLVMTDRWTQNRDFTQYLSNAATMTSLLLGVVAIFYSFISNNSMSNSLGSISEISKDVKKVGSQIAEYQEISGGLIDEGKRSTQAFEHASKDIKDNLHNFHSLLKAMDEKTLAMRDFMEGIPSQIVQLEEKFNKFADNSQKQKEVTTTIRKVKTWSLERFISRSDALENLITYACILHANTSNAIDVDEVCKAMGIGSALELNSFIRCLDSADLLTLKSMPEQSRAYLVSIDPPIDSDEYEALMIQDFKDTYTSTHIDTLELAIDGIKKYVAALADHP